MVQVDDKWSGSRVEKQQIKDVMSALVYSSKQAEYNNCMDLLLKRCNDDPDCDLFSYFLLNRDNIADE